MATDSTITREQLSTLFLNTELGGDTRHLDHFSYAQKGASTYSFGLVQFDVGGNPQARRFLRDNGFTDGDIALLSQQGGLSTQQRHRACRSGHRQGACNQSGRGRCHRRQPGVAVGHGGL